MAREENSEYLGSGVQGVEKTGHNQLYRLLHGAIAPRPTDDQ